MKAYLLGIRLFYKYFAPFSIALSFLFWIVAERPLGIALLRFIPLFIFFKAFTGGLIRYYVKTFEGRYLYFYFNMGLSERRLFVTALTLDLPFFGLFLLLASFIF